MGGQYLTEGSLEMKVLFLSGQIIGVYLLSKCSKLHNLETHFCELLRPRAPPFQKIKRNPLNQVTFMQKSCFLGPIIFEIPQPN